MSSFKWFQKPADFLHHNYNFDVIIKTSDYDIKNLVVIQKALESFGTTKGEHVDRVNVTKRFGSINAAVIISSVC